MSRDRNLDILRAVGIILVVLFHIGAQFEKSDLDIVAQFFQHYGRFGVDVFFPLSGYLITANILRQSQKQSVANFLLKRSLRIVPLYFVAVTVYVIASILTKNEVDTLANIWQTYLFLTGWFIFFQGTQEIPYTITWSLSVEVLAYLLIGCCAILDRKNFARMIAIMIVAPIALRFILLETEYSRYVYFFPLTRLDSIALGAYVAIAINDTGRDRQKTNRFLVGLMVGSFLGLLTFNPPLKHGFLYTAIAAGTLLATINVPPITGRIFEPVIGILERIGIYSYNIYLFHYYYIYAIVLFAREALNSNISFWLMAALVLSASYFLGKVLYENIEIRGLNLYPKIVAKRVK